MNPGTEGLKDSARTGERSSSRSALTVSRSHRNWRQSNSIQALPLGVRLRVRHAFRRGVISRNLIRQIDWMTDGDHTGITVRGAEKSMVENNVLDVGNPHPLGFTNAVAPEYFNNRTSGGTFIRGYDEVARQEGSELQTLIDDIFTLSL